MEKVQFPLANIILLNKTEITNEQKDKLDQVQKQLETELKKSGK
jgi:G3E family GTPase